MGTIPARRGGAINDMKWRVIAEKSRATVLSIGDSGKSMIARAILARTENFMQASSRKCNHAIKEPLWLNRSSTERAGQRTAHASASE